MSVLITKADGVREPFNPHKLIRSLERSGAPRSEAERIEREISAELYREMTTSELYRRAFSKLRELKRESAARYSLKRAILDFGPSGFPFEEYLAQLFIVEGYGARTDQIVPGACVEHEVDVVLTRGNTTTYVEAKFHNNAGYKTDLKVVLYVKARMDDINTRAHTAHAGLLATNTKFTSQVVQYASCAGLELLSWEYPENRTLHDRIDAARVFPITALTTLNRREKMALLERKVVLCRELKGRTHELKDAGVAPGRVADVLAEAEALCSTAEALQ